MMEGLFTALEDAFPFILRKHKKVSLAVTCFVFFLIGIPMVTNVSASFSGTNFVQRQRFAIFAKNGR